MSCERSIELVGGAETNWNANLNPIPIPTPDPKPKKTSQGRRKIPIRKITDKSKKQVTFSKRRKGLFNKARELCVLCGANVAVIAFSEAGKAFSFGHPSADAVIRRYLHGGSGDPDDRRLFWWDRSVEELGLGDLEIFAASLERLRSNVQRRIGDLDELDRLEPLMPVKNEIVLYGGGDDLSQTHDNYWNLEEIVDWSDFEPLPSPDWGFVQDQYQSGFDGGDLGSVVAMAAGCNSYGGGFN